MTQQITAAERTTELTIGHSTLQFSWSSNRPVSLDVLDGSKLIGRPGVALVEVLTATEQRARTSQSYSRSAVGERLRYVRHEGDITPWVKEVRILQRDPVTDLEVMTRLEHFTGTRAVRVTSTVRNQGIAPVILTAISSATIGFGSAEDGLADLSLHSADSEWLAENRWHEVPLRDILPQLDLRFHGQDGRGRFALASHGAWSTGEHLGIGVIADRRTDAAFGWQIDSSGPWIWELNQTQCGGVLTMLGPTDREHQFAHALTSGDEFTTVPVVLVSSTQGRDGVFAELTRYRRAAREQRPIDNTVPIIYNDFMNTLMGQPSTAAVEPLIDAAAEAGAEYFCIDAGWFADPAIGDWWDTVGEWREAPARFEQGLSGVIDRIHARGMRSGLWLEPEVVGVASPSARQLPDEAFFTRFGERVREHDRYHLDFRHPAARDHLDRTVARLISEYGISYLKLDYNINPGAGTDWLAATAGDGLLAHTRAFRRWLQDVQARHPHLLIENCSSGAMRADFSLLAVTHLQSTSDQQDFLLYPPIAASAPASILPEQCGNWAYPHASMSDEETAFTLTTGLSGRLYLSGFLDHLSASQRHLVREAVDVHRLLRRDLDTSIPFWPLGLPQWDDPVIALGSHTRTGDVLFIWDRSAEPQTIDLAGIVSATQLFPVGAPQWEVTPEQDGIRIHTPSGASARVLRVGVHQRPSTGSGGPTA